MFYCWLGLGKRWKQHLRVGEMFALQQDNPGASGERLHEGPGVDQEDSQTPSKTSTQV